MSKCPVCKKATLKPFEGMVRVQGVEVLGHGERCGSCGEVLIDDAEMGRLEQSAAAAMVARGIRDGGELKFVRKMAGLKATELATLLGVRPETVSRWERGEAEFDRAVAFAVGELYDRPRVVRAKLEAFAS